jgi:hypothetical protein
MNANDYIVGDIVELVDYCNSSMSAKLGATAQVYHIDEDYVYVKWNRQFIISKARGQQDGGYKFNQFKIIKRNWKNRFGGK